MTVEALLERLLTELPVRIAQELRRAEPMAPLTVSRAARVLGIRRDSLRLAVKAGTVRTVPWEGKRARISPDEVDRLRREGLGKPGKRRRRPSQTSPAEAIRALDVDLDT